MDSTFCFPAELTAPSELRVRSPRLVSLTASGIQTALAIALLLGLAAASAVWAGSTFSHRMQQTSALKTQGQETTGQVIHVWSSGSLEPRVSYSFAVNGVVHTAETRVPKQLLQSVAKAGSLPIRYLPGNPAINHPSAWERSPYSGLALFVAPAVAAILGLLLLMPLIAERRMAAEGVPVLAMVRTCTHSRNGYLVHYEFRAGDGNKFKGRGWFQKHQEPGDGIWILYLPKAPRRNVPYPLSFCRVAE
ncbi:MAG TPA: hypothetical protein VF730_05865 [Terracidiphilus sp.]